MGRGSHHPDPRVWAAVQAAQAEGRIVSDTGVNAEFVAAQAGGLAAKLPVPSALPDGISEKEFQSEVRQLFVSNGWDFYHTLKSKGSDAGFPDCVVARPTGPRTSELFVAELKSEKGRLTPGQNHWLSLFGNFAVPIYVWFPEDWPEIVRLATSPVNEYRMGPPCSLPPAPPAASPPPSATPTPSTRRSSGRRPK